MGEILAGAGAALWLGILTSLSPCPMANNVAAVSYIGRTLDVSGRVFWTGLLYAAGRMLAYVGLGTLLVSSLLSAPLVSHALQKFMIRALGPFLLVAGVLLLGWIPLRLPQFSIGERVQARLARAGMAGGALLGFLFALTFCPVSAALFFGSLLPLAVESRSPVLLPSLYGFGTAIPVLVVAVVLGGGLGRLGRLFDVLPRVELWARRATAAVFVVIGGWFFVKYTVGLL